MSTLNVDSELLKQTEAVAAAHGMTAEEFAEEALRRAVITVAPRQVLRNGLPVMVVDKFIPAIDPRAVQRSLEEEGF
jgi:hypothetical protein